MSGETIRKPRSLAQSVKSAAEFVRANPLTRSDPAAGFLADADKVGGIMSPEKYGRAGVKRK